MELLTAYKGKAHVTSMQFRALIESICGSESRIANLDEKMILELAENNTVKIRSGLLIHHGAVMQVKRGTYDQITYQNGSQGMKRIDLIVAKYSKSSDTKIEDAEWELIQGEASDSDPAAPTFTEGDMQDGDLIDRCAFAELHFDGINVTEVKQLVPVARNTEELEAEIDELNRKRCYSSDEIDTGKTWINGEKVYRKCFVLTSTGTFAHGISSLDKVLGIDATYYQTGTYGYANCANHITFQKSNIYTSFPSSGITASSSNPIYITVEYTKS